MIHTINYETVSITLAESEGTVNKPSKIEEIFRLDDTIDWGVEHLWVVGMNVKNDVHMRHLVAKGGYNALAASPPDYIIPCLRLNLRHLILVHNHPSGDVEASHEDEIFTRKAKRACELLGLTLLDHIILSETNCLSMKTEDLL